MTQNNEREALIEDEFNKQYPYDDMNGWDRKLFKSGYQAATQASESEINSLKERVAELQSHLSSQSIEIANYDVTLESYAHKVAELQVDNIIMRDTLNKIALGHVYDADIIESAGDCLQRLSKSQSLAEHDNATIDRCKNIVADDALAITFQSMGAYRSAIIKHIGELKATP